MPFILIFVPLALSLGYDTIVGVSIPFLGAAAGFAGAFFNPFTVGIAQGIAGLPLYSGLGYRLIVWALGTIIVIVIVMRYAARILRNPEASPVYEDDLEKRKKLLGIGPGHGKGARPHDPQACPRRCSSRGSASWSSASSSTSGTSTRSPGFSWRWAFSPGSSAGSRETRSAGPSSTGPRTWSTPP